ncbi:hypothetical protein BDZ91DRAFT_225970 [Kalaharituber pfeilii]|nr:hypothetical protein BDZ91DRAFT_225970 [Kalaharituber pfeilii]
MMLLLTSAYLPLSRWRYVTLDINYPVFALPHEFPGLSMEISEPPPNTALGFYLGEQSCNRGRGFITGIITPVELIGGHCNPYILQAVPYIRGRKCPMVRLGRIPWLVKLEFKGGYDVLTRMGMTHYTEYFRQLILGNCFNNTSGHEEQSPTLVLMTKGVRLPGGNSVWIRGAGDGWLIYTVESLVPARTPLIAENAWVIVRYD